MPVLPATWKAEVGGSRVQDKPGQLNKTCLKIKTNRVGGVAQWQDPCLVWVHCPVLQCVLGASYPLPITAPIPSFPAVSVSSGCCYNKMPQTRWLKHWKSIFSQLWSVESPRSGSGKVSFWQRTSSWLFTDGCLFTVSSHGRWFSGGLQRAVWCLFF